MITLTASLRKALLFSAVAAATGTSMLLALFAPHAWAQDGPGAMKMDMTKMDLKAMTTSMKGGPAPSPVKPEDLAKAFEVTTIKPNNSASGKGVFGGTPRGLNLTDFTAHMILKMAFGNIADDRIVGEPAWMTKDHYDFAGQFEEGKRVAPPDMYQPPLRAMLADRFQLKFHYEQKEFPVYELVVARGGSKLQPNTDGIGPGGMNNPGSFVGKRISMATFTNRFPGGLGRIVVDKTSLTGEYDFELKWTPDQRPTGGADDPGGALAPVGPTIFTALEEQLGLRLQTGRAPLEVLVIDKIEKPSEN